ncbi:uracil-DNA glycosylase [Tropicimonas sp. TH_r6]|uniref:uracil-DNA glycosylase n=1 Tax=Tropicimonas sp. TH_r6 TaxID=3082085 RepID=UPI002955AEFD|nr:uracil-DNA glycosylase [Tropicimonas sp. TH_r6]MDV7142225.1 uracil-DNA glycosylase [Tropicimonas sp. TH_r6]
MVHELAYHDAFAALDFQISMGADEATVDAPVDRFALSKTLMAEAQAKKEAAALPTARGAPAVAPPPKADPIGDARMMAGAAESLEALEQALASFPHCELKQGARSLVFSDGNPKARLMIIGEAPGRDEDIQGRPFVGRAGQLLDRMLAAIDLARDGSEADSAVYITNILPWRPPQNRDPRPEEIDMLKPFVQRHVELVAPEALVLMGNISCQAMLGRRGITRIRGNWVEALGRPALPMFHPAYLLRNPGAKREAWADLLSLKARLRGDAAP